MAKPQRNTLPAPSSSSFASPKRSPSATAPVAPVVPTAPAAPKLTWVKISVPKTELIFEDDTHVRESGQPEKAGATASAEELYHKAQMVKRKLGWKETGVFALSDEDHKAQMTNRNLARKEHVAVSVEEEAGEVTSVNVPDQE